MEISICLNNISQNFTHISLPEVFIQSPQNLSGPLKYTNALPVV